jgi:hypothetical protein
VSGGAADARSRVYAQTCGHAHARVPTCIGIAARTKDGLDVCMYVYVYKFMHCMLYIYMHILVREMGMGVHAAAPPAMHTCVRLRAPTMRPLRSRARVAMPAGI